MGKRQHKKRRKQSPAELAGDYEIYHIGVLDGIRAICNFSSCVVSYLAAVLVAAIYRTCKFGLACKKRKYFSRYDDFAFRILSFFTICQRHGVWRQNGYGSRLLRKKSGAYCAIVLSVGVNLYCSLLLFHSRSTAAIPVL